MRENDLRDPAISAGRASFDQRFLPWIESFVRFVAAHWLALVNLALAVFVGLPALSPVLVATGNPWLEALGGAIFFAYRATCHQLPGRSFFIFGEQMAWCERDVAVWGSVLAGGLLFSFVRGRLKQLDIKWYIAFCVPMAVDGLTQLFGFRESSWELRTLTGTLFGLASVWLVFPILERGMRDVRESLTSRPGD